MGRRPYWNNKREQGLGHSCQAALLGVGSTEQNLTNFSIVDKTLC